MSQIVRKVDGRDLHALIKAADALVLLQTRKSARPRRNRAIPALLRYTGSHVLELAAQAQSASKTTIS